MKKNILTIIIMASCLLNLILTVVIVFAVVPTMNKTSQLVDKVATAIDLETDAEAAGDYSIENLEPYSICLLYTSPSPRDRTRSRMPSSA